MTYPRIFIFLESHTEKAFPFPPQPLIHGEFLGLDQDVQQPVASSARAPVAPHLRDTQIYAYTTGVYGACSVSCDGGMQYRSVQCMLQDPVYPRTVDETDCIARVLQRPACQQACNMQPCANAEYSVSVFSGVCTAGLPVHLSIWMSASTDRVSKDPHS